MNISVTQIEFEAIFHKVATFEEYDRIKAKE